MNEPKPNTLNGSESSNAMQLFEDKFELRQGHEYSLGELIYRLAGLYGVEPDEISFMPKMNGHKITKYCVRQRGQFANIFVKLSANGCIVFK